MVRVFSCSSGIFPHVPDNGAGTRKQPNQDPRATETPFPSPSLDRRPQPWPMGPDEPLAVSTMSRPTQGPSSSLEEFPQKIGVPLQEPKNKQPLNLRFPLFFVFQWVGFMLPVFPHAG